MATATFIRAWLENNDDERTLPPGTPPTLKFDGPWWFTTQLTISLVIGINSFFLFSYCRTRWPLLFAPRTKLKGFSPHEAHAHQAFFGWIMPTIRTSEFTVLQIVGLDAAVLLNFFKMSFYLFSGCSMFAITILMPLNWKHNKEDDDDDWPGNNITSIFHTYMPRNAFDPPTNRTAPPDWIDLLTDANSYLTIQLMFTYLFTILALYFTYKNYLRFTRSRQLFSLELVHSIPARTVLVTDLPQHLRGDAKIAEYFENMGMSVESVSVVREVGALRGLLDQRTKALLDLERCWVSYVGNPSTVEEYDPEGGGVLGDTAPGRDSDIEGGGRARFVVPHRPRPTLRPGWFKPKVDALEYLEERFREADEKVKKKRRVGKFRSTRAAFVTFEKMSSAQIAQQVAHAPSVGQMKTYQAPEPRDIVWANMVPSTRSIQFRDIFVLATMALLFFFWFFPITALAGLLSYQEIKRTLPWLGRLIDKNEQIRAIVQNSLPSVAMIALNACLPFILEALTYVQGYRARSWVEYSLLKKYFLFLLVNVVFIFLLATTYWQLLQDLANSPATVPEKLAQALQAGQAKHFFLSYVILQGLGIMPLQLLNLGVIIPRVFYRMFLTRTPRDYAELNAPPMINYGIVYPQAILMFVITMLYSVVQPLILIFGAIYFGVGYMVYKYKLLFVFYKPYESQGQAWPITFIRLIWGIVIFQLFMIGIFTLRKAFILSSILVPLLFATVAWGWYLDSEFGGLSKFVSLSSVFEVQRGEETADVMRLRAGHPVTWSQSNLNRRRYAQNDDTLYVAPEDERTDYSQPPMANWYSGVLNTGKRRYGHPALNGVLPEPWLPLKKGQSLVNHRSNGRAANGDGDAVVLTLRKRYSVAGLKRRGLSQEGRPASVAGSPGPTTSLTGANEFGGYGSTGATAGPIPTGSNTSLDTSNPWMDATPPASRSVLRQQASGSSGRTLAHRLSYDHASGVIMLPDDGGWLEEDEEDSDELPGNGGLDASVMSVASEGASSVADTSTPGSEIVSGNATPVGGARVSRYGTYFHHPERRRQVIPGAFPGR
ncbi:hypothetical protein BJ165DRAFT_1481442 [Panaeolus papilionaceus]|nr:hypothetical protein BJ165DRAFT_1481442 [Panaeolus papilionaceus]